MLGIGHRKTVVSVTYQDLIAFAEAVDTSSASEVALRNAAARAYYGAYHCALEAADSVDFRAPLSSFGGASHQNLRDFWGDVGAGDEFSSERKSVSYMLRQTHTIRCMADYNLDEEFNAETLNMHMSLCNRIIEKISTIKEGVGA